MNEKVNRIIRILLLVPFSAAAIYLLLLSMFSTAITLPSERTYLLGDSPLVNISFAVAAAVILCVICRKAGWAARFIDRVNSDAAFSGRCRRTVLTVFAVTAGILVLIIQKGARADAQYIADTAAQWMKGDYSAFRPDGYVDRYPNQLGMVLLQYFLGYVVGNHNYMFYQLTHVVMLAAAYAAMGRMSDMAGRSPFRGLVTVTACAMFLPAALYCNFVYGTIPGFALSVFAAERTLRFAKKKHWWDAALAVVFALFAVVIKMNYMIFVIGAVIFAVLLAVEERRWQMVFPAVGMALVLAFSGWLVRGVTRAVTGVTPGEGIAKTAWVAMGMQENNNLYDGWYNRYTIKTYAEAGCDTERQQEIVDRYLDGRLAEFRDDPAMAVRFFAGKNASQWNNPDFESFWISQVMYDRIDNSPLVLGILSEKGVETADKVLDLGHFAILLGVVLYLVLERRKTSMEVFCGITMAGGFVFHTVWEAKSQYTLPYFMLLIPIAVLGWCALVRRLAGKEPASRAEKKWFIAVAAVGAAAIVLIASGVSGVLSDIFLRNEDDEIYSRLPQYGQYTSEGSTASPQPSQKRSPRSGAE